MYSYTVSFPWKPFASVTPAPEEIHWSRSDSRGGPQAARHEEEKGSNLTIYPSDEGSPYRYPWSRRLSTVKDIRVNFGLACED